MAQLTFNENTGYLTCTGDWTLNMVESLRLQWKRLPINAVEALVIDAASIKRIDSAGGLFLHQLIDRLRLQGVEVTDCNASLNVKSMLKMIATLHNARALSDITKTKRSWLYLLGEASHSKWLQCIGLMQLIGELVVRFSRALLDFRRFHFKNIMDVMEHAGLRALPILALLSALIGVVLTYQMGLQLKNYGANIYIVYYSGIALQREFAPLITAIIVAGRTSSAFTAQLGSMKVNEEIDALVTMGLAPTELLVLPKVIGLLIVFPMLIFWADIFGTLGSMVMSKLTMDVDYLAYLLYLKKSLGVNEYLLGLIKAPVFALIIALVGCYQGFLVKGSANSVGLSTTKSVVQAIFLIIVADAIFSFIYSGLGV